MKFEIIKKSILLSVLIILLVIYYGMDNQKIERTYELKKDNAIAVMVYDEDSESYIAQESVPVGFYKMDEDKTYCVNGGKITGYNSTLGKVNYSLKTDDKCYVYFYYYVPTLSDIVISNKSSVDYISSQDNTIYRVVDQNGIRYEGNDPDNYVWYNCANNSNISTCERWRIIGTFDGADIGLKTGDKYTKIARSTPLETEMYWQDVPIGATGEIVYNDWEQSTIKSYLNGEYLKGLSSSAKEMIASESGTYPLWYLLGPDDGNIWNSYTPDWYNAERESGYAGNDGNASGSTRAAIGLMYPSDYGYAAYGSNCNNETTEKLSSYSGNCGAVNWLNNGYGDEWLISPVVGTYRVCFIASSSGGAVYDRPSDMIEQAARPVLYLASSVSISGGEGTYSSPYVLK